MSQKVMDGSLSSPSARNLTRESMAEKKAETTMPESTSMRIGVTLYRVRHKIRDRHGKEAEDKRQGLYHECRQREHQPDGRAKARPG